MDETIAILGRQPALGIAELESLYGADRIESIDNVAARIKFSPCTIDFRRLGGTIKLCKLLTVLDTTQWHAIQKFLIDTAPSQAERMPEGKMHLGLSVYGNIVVTPAQLMATGLTIKKAIQRNGGRTVRLVPNKQIELNTAQVLHNKLLTPNGWELVFIRNGHTTLIGQTVDIQDIADYTIRDRGRPRRDARVGMLPPKLAQIIINLATGPQEFSVIEPQLPKNLICLPRESSNKMRAERSHITVLDPFCGTGVVLQEARLMGYGAYGTDIDPRMIAFTNQNLSWLIDTYHLPPLEVRTSLGDATSYQWQPPITAVACEAYLGRPFTALPSTEILSRTVSECNLIIKKFLRHIHPQLATSTRLCIAIPAWQIAPDTFRHLPLIDQLTEMGYNQVSLQHVRGKDLLYYRSDQYVARQLLIITRK